MAIEDLGLSYRGCKQARCGLEYHPCFDGLARHRFHELRKYVGVENDHSPNSGGSRMGSRGTSGKSTPPTAAKRFRIAFARFDGELCSTAKLERRMSRASSSMERP